MFFVSSSNLFLPTLFGFRFILFSHSIISQTRIIIIIITIRIITRIIITFRICETNNQRIRQHDNWPEKRRRWNVFFFLYLFIFNLNPNRRYRLPIGDRWLLFLRPIIERTTNLLRQYRFQITRRRRQNWRETIKRVTQRAVSSRLFKNNIFELLVIPPTKLKPKMVLADT